MAQAGPSLGDDAPPLAGRTILQVTPALDAGGVERTTIDVSAAVVRAGGRSLVASAGGRLEAALAEGGAEAVRLPLDSRSPLALVSSARALKRLILREGVDLVHARSRLPAWAALWAARRTGAVFVTTYAGVYTARSGLKRRYNSVMARGQAVIANSAFTRDHLIAEHATPAERVVTIPRGIDLARFDAAAVSPERIAAMQAAFGRRAQSPSTWLILAGRLTRWKGQALAIEALARASAAGADLVLVLAGDDQGRSGYREELGRLAARHAVADRVVFAGHVEDMAAAYLAADVAIAPSLEPEAFGRTAAEPQAMGRPILAADHGAARETVADGVAGRLVAPGDVKAWGRAFLEAARWTPAERDALGARGQGRVQALYALEAMTSATVAVYARLLQGRPLR